MKKICFFVTKHPKQTFKLGPTLKRMVCRAPTYPPKTGRTTQKIIAFLRFFSLILLTNSSLKSLKTVF